MYVAGSGKEYIIPRSLINMESQPLPYIHNIPTKVGADTDAILGALGFSAEEIAKASK